MYSTGLNGKASYKGEILQRHDQQVLAREGQNIGGDMDGVRLT